MRHWALTVCVACVLVGALELLLPKQDSFKSIKTVLALYILLSVLSPAKQVDWSGLAVTAQTAAAAPADYSAYVDEYAGAALQAKLEESLARAGVSGQVKTAVQDGRLCVTVRSPTPEKARHALCEALNENQDVSIVAEETKDEN